MTPLYKLAHARAGDKGEHTTISIFAYDDQDYPILVEQLTTQAVSTFFSQIYMFKMLNAIHFQIYRASTLSCMAPDQEVSHQH